MAIHKINGVTVRTNNEFPPIPLRQFDWSAIDDDTYDGADDSHCPIGRGATEQEAIDDLLEQIDADQHPNAYGRDNGQFGVGA
jgi:hypothetical protein